MDLEKQYVTNTYNLISQHFSSTRYSHWKSVKEFIEELSEASKANKKNKINFLDFGCGNGKYLSLCENFNTTGFDNCENLLQIVKTNFPKTKIIKDDMCKTNDCLINSFDSIICVAAIHHLSTEIRRIEAIKNIIKYLKKNGKALITVWSNNIDKTKYEKLETEGDYLIGWNNECKRYYHLFESEELDKLIEKADILNEIQIVSKIYECDNWIIIIQKK
jgi:SAM-dependent methyltransferase